MSPVPYFLLGFLCLASLGCDDDEVTIGSPLEVPPSYNFQRNGTSSVDFSGQTTRIAMATALSTGLTDPTQALENLNAMFRNEGPNGEEVAPFTDPTLNGSTKALRSKVAASADYFGANATEQAVIRADFDDLIADQAISVFPRWNELAAPGTPGQIADGTNTRYVTGTGLEHNQVFAKSLIGALMLDQALNNYLSPTVLDQAQNRADNDNATLEVGTNYTTMEHFWDEAYGYVFGASPDPANPLPTLGQDDDFLNEYLGKVDQDPDFAGLGQAVFDAFKTGRAALVAGDYAERDRQAATLQAALSQVIAARGVYYLARGADAIENNSSPTAAFHALSEAYGFVYSLQFTRDPATGAPYFARSEVEALLARLVDPATTGLWEVEPATLRTLATDISDRFDFAYAAAAN